MVQIPFMKNPELKTVAAIAADAWLSGVCETAGVCAHPAYSVVRDDVGVADLYDFHNCYDEGDDADPAASIADEGVYVSVA